MWVVAGLSITALVTIAVILRDRASPRPPASGREPPGVEKAKREVLPFRQSGLIFHWADDKPAVYVRQSQWQALSEEARAALGRSIAVAKKRRSVTVFDETLTRKLAVCSAETGCQRVAE